MRIRLSSDAKQDLLNGSRFYERQEKGLGQHFRVSISADIDALTRFGGIYQVVMGHHRALCKTFPYSIFYRVDEGDWVTVVAVLDQRRDPNRARERLE